MAKKRAGKPRPDEPAPPSLDAPSGLPDDAEELMAENASRHMPTPNGSSAATPPPSDTVADAVARFDAKRRREEAALTADPSFAAGAARGEKWRAAEREVAAATKPLGDAIKRFIADHPSCPPDSGLAHTFEALKWAWIDARDRAFALAGFPLRERPSNAASLLAELRGVKLDGCFTLAELCNMPRPTEGWWQDAEGLIRSNPFLPALPEKPDDGRARYAALVRWAEECVAYDFKTVWTAFQRFELTLTATTVPMPGSGGRRVDGIAHAVALSEAAEALSREIATVEHKLFVRHGRTMTAHPPGVAMLESDSPDGPWTPIPPDAIVVQEMGVGGDGADAVVWAAMDSARRVVAFPVDKLNALQAARPGARHDRFHAGDVVTLAELETLASAARLLSLRAPAELLVGMTAPQPSSSAEPSGGSSDDEHAPAPALTENQASVLQTMALLDASRLVSAELIASEMDASERLSARTIGGIVRKLITLGLAERPEGDRSGVRLTTRGRRQAPKIAD